MFPLSFFSCTSLLFFATFYVSRNNQLGVLWFSLMIMGIIWGFERIRVSQHMLIWMSVPLNINPNIVRSFLFLILLYRLPNLGIDTDRIFLRARCSRKLVRQIYFDNRPFLSYVPYTQGNKSQFFPWIHIISRCSNSISPNVPYSYLCSSFPRYVCRVFLDLYIYTARFPSISV